MRKFVRKIPSSPAPPQFAATRGPVFTVSRSVPLSAYEESVLKDLCLPYFLPYSRTENADQIFFSFRPPQGWRPLLSADRGEGQHQSRGIKRLNQVLRSMREARLRMLSPGFHALSLRDLWLHPSGVAIPLLPLGEHIEKARRLRPELADFWELWRDFYRVQTELADLGRALCGKKDWRQLEAVFSKLEREWTPPAKPIASRRPAPPLSPVALPNSIAPTAANVEGVNLFLPRGKRKHFTVSGPQDTSPLPPPREEYRVAELREITPDEKAMRKALLWEAEYLIGRDPALCDLCLEELWVGRLHARLERRAGHWLIKDFSSRNGTYVNGRRLRGEEMLLLPRRCELVFGRSRFEFAIR